MTQLKQKAVLKAIICGLGAGILGVICGWAIIIYSRISLDGVIRICPTTFEWFLMTYFPRLNTIHASELLFSTLFGVIGFIAGLVYNVRARIS